MLLNLFEDIGEEILPDKLAIYLASIDDDDWTTLTRVLVGHRDAAKKLKRAAEQSIYLQYVRAFLLNRFGPDGAMLEFVNHPEKYPLVYQRIVRAGADPKNFIRMVKSIGAGRISSAAVNPANLYNRLVHFRGDTNGATGILIPEIQRHRIQPNDWLPDVLARLEEIFEANRIAIMQDVPLHLQYETMGDVPGQYIPAKDSFAHGEKVLHTYEDSDTTMVWLNLNMKNNSLEARAMGHCANTNSHGAVLYSFRSLHRLYIRDRGEYVDFHRPRLTAAINPETKTCYELRGRGNSKPKEEYHPYIVDLVVKGDVKKFLYSSYENSNQFKVSHLDDHYRSVISQYVEDVPIDQPTDSDTWVFFHGNGVVPEERWRRAVREVYLHCRSLFGFADYTVDPNDYQRLIFHAEYTWRAILLQMFQRWMTSDEYTLTPDDFKPLVTLVRKNDNLFENRKNLTETPSPAVEQRGREILLNYASQNPDYKSWVVSDTSNEQSPWIVPSTMAHFYAFVVASPRQRLIQTLHDALNDIRPSEYAFGYHYDMSTLSNLKAKPAVFADLDNQFSIDTDGRDEDEMAEAYESFHWMGSGVNLSSVKYVDTSDAWKSTRDVRQILELVKNADWSGAADVTIEDYFMSDGPHTEWIEHCRDKPSP